MRKLTIDPGEAFELPLTIEKCLLGYTGFTTFEHKLNEKGVTHCCWCAEWSHSWLSCSGADSNAYAGRFRWLTGGRLESRTSNR